MDFNYKIKCIHNEYWWGGTVHDGIHMPFYWNTQLDHPLEDTVIYRNLETDQKGNQCAPFLVSSMGRYIWSELPFTFKIEKGLLSISSKSTIVIKEGLLTLKKAFLHGAKNYFSSTGMIPDPLLFTMPQYNTWIEMMYEPTQEKILQYAKSILENGMPAGVLTIDDNWQEDYGVWRFHAGRFPNPKKMIDELHAMGFKVMLWVCNFISPDSLTGRELTRKNYVIKTLKGDVAIAKWWNGHSLMLDITHDDAVNWFHNQLHHLMLSYGVDGFKFDSGDVHHFSEYFIGKKKITGNQYSELWAKIGLNYPLNEYRACWKMGGQPLAQRLCDKNHSWDLENGLKSLIPNGLAQGLLGYAYSCPDMIGGGEYMNFLENSDTLDMELIVRNAQCVALFPMMQFSVAPWRVLDKEHLDICIEMAHLHRKFGSKILALAKKSALTGEPIIRPLNYVFPHCECEKIIDQFMLGNTILVAPVLEKNARTRTVFFPPGTWKSDLGEIIHGQCTQNIHVPLHRLPWYEKQSNLDL